MKIGGIENQWVMTVTMDDVVVSAPEVTELFVVEEAGNVLPTFSLTFETDNPRLSDKKLLENAQARISFGPDLEHKSETQYFRPTKVTVLKNFRSLGYDNVQILGILDQQSYISHSEIRVFDKTSVQAMQDIAGNHLMGYDGVSSSEDRMKWLQPNITPKSMIDHLWSHGRVSGSSVLVPAIGADGILVCRDLVHELEAKKSRWLMTEYASQIDDQTIVVSAPVIVSNSGFLNNWVGNERRGYELDLVRQTQREIIADFTGVTGTGVNTVPRSALSLGLYRRFFPEMPFDEDNQHQYFNDSYIQNLVNLALFSLVTVSVSTTTTFRPVRLLDTVLYMVPMPQEKTEGGIVRGNPVSASQFFSGKYVVTKRMRGIKAGQYSESFSLNRAGFNL